MHLATRLASLQLYESKTHFSKAGTSRTWDKPIKNHIQIDTAVVKKPNIQDFFFFKKSYRFITVVVPG